MEKPINKVLIYIILFFNLFLNCYAKNKSSILYEFNHLYQKQSLKMENLTEKDVLQELNRTSLELILEELRNYMPKSIRAHHYIYNYLKNSGQSIESPRFKPKFYSPRNNTAVSNITLIAITDEEDYWIMLFTLEEGAYQLKDCLNNTNIINWNTTIKPKISVEVEIADEIYEILKTKRNDWVDSIERYYYFPLNSISSLENITINSNFEMKNLTENNTNQINEKWPHQYNKSIEFIKTSLKLNGGFGLFLNDNIVSWILLNDFFALGNLYTIESQRRKGLAEILTKISLKNFLETYQIDGLVYIMKDNLPSEKLFKKIGFILVNEIKWMF